MEAFGRCKDCVLWEAYSPVRQRGKCIASEAEEPVIRLMVQVDGKGSDGKTYRAKGIVKAILETPHDFGCASFQPRE